MLDLMRRKAQSPYIQATMLIIIVVFVFWGVGINRGNGQKAVVTVNGESVSLIDYQQAYDQAVKRVRDQLGGNLPPGLLKNMGLKEKVINDLTQRLLLQQAARAMGVMVTDQEVRDKIAAMEVFRNNGSFDPKWYRQVLSSSRMSTTDFENGTRNDLLMAKLMDFITGFADVADSELKERFNFQFGEKRVSYLKVKADDYKDKVKIEEDKLKEYFSKNRAKYRSEPKVSLRYLRFPFTGQGSAGLVSEDDVSAYYNGHLADYQIPERRKARHILLRVDADSPASEVKAQEKKAAELMKKLKNGANFVAMARDNSDDPGSKANGGDLGFFSRGRMVKPFEDAVFSMKEGELRQVKSRFGIHIIRLDAISPSHTRTLAEAKTEIRRKLLRDKAKNLAYKKADEAYEKIILAGSLDKYSQESGVKVESTKFFSRSNPPAVFRVNREFVRAAFSLKKGELSSLLEGDDSYGIIFVDERQEPEDPQLAQVRKRVLADYIVAASLDLARSAAEKVQKGVSGGADLKEAAAKAGFKDAVSVTPYFSRARHERVTLPAPVMTEAQNLTASRPYPDSLIASNREFFVITFKEARAPLGINFYGEKEKIREAMRKVRKSALLAAWAENLRSVAKVEVNRKYI